MLEQIIEQYPEEVFLQMNEHPNAVIGVDESSMRLCYSMSKIIENLMKDMSEEDALEYYYFNIEGSKGKIKGKELPILVNDRF